MGFLAPENGTVHELPFDSANLSIEQLLPVDNSSGLYKAEFKLIHYKNNKENRKKIKKYGNPKKIQNEKFFVK